MSRTLEETEAYLQDIIEQRDALLDKLSDIQNAYDGGYYTDIQHHLTLVWSKFVRPDKREIVRTAAGNGTFAKPADLTPDATLKERIESYKYPEPTKEQKQNQIDHEAAVMGDIQNDREIEEILSKYTEPTVEDVFGNTTKDNKYWIVDYSMSYQIQSDNGCVLRFDKSLDKAKRKADLALKLLNQAEPDDIDLLIEMLY